VTNSQGWCHSCPHHIKGRKKDTRDIGEKQEEKLPKWHNKPHITINIWEMESQTSIHPQITESERDGKRVRNWISVLLRSKGHREDFLNMSMQLKNGASTSHQAKTQIQNTRNITLVGSFQ
jgi:hypothetical protein